MFRGDKKKRKKGGGGGGKYLCRFGDGGNHRVLSLSKGYHSYVL